MSDATTLGDVRTMCVMMEKLAEKIRMDLHMGTAKPVLWQTAAIMCRSMSEQFEEFYESEKALAPQPQEGGGR